MKKKTSKTKSLVVAKRGQPTKYKPEYCDEIRKFMGRGYSLSAFAGSTHCSRATIYEWERAIPEFSYAVKSARAMRVAYLEKSLLRDRRKIND